MRLLLIHAHPDDETLWSGVTAASHAARGDEVHVLTCTLGEEGEVIPAELRHLELPAGQEREPQGRDPLGQWRRAELAAATQALGVTSSTVLGDDGGQRYRDSGMAGTPSAAHPRAFVAAEVAEVAAQVRAHIEHLAPDVVVTYDEHGGYGHPDHVHTHRVVVEAVRGMSDRPALLAIVTPQAWYAEDLAWLTRELSDERRQEWGVRPPDDDHTARLSVVSDEVATHVTLAPEALPAQAAALREHRTQVRVLPGMFALSNDVAGRLAGREAFVRLDPDTGRPVARSGPVRPVKELA